MSNEELILVELKEISKLLKAQTNILSSLHNLFNQFNADYLEETHKESDLINNKEPE
jgi:hypothetical protein